jgi:pimeloyl-ACP methyl ester carboxylesterase
LPHARDRCRPACLPSAAALAAPTYGPRLEGFDYGYPVKTFALESQRQPLEMAYLDIAPKKAPIGVVVLLHGKNFCAATWKESIKPLVAAGYRVIAPDQVGFCKSSKPERYQYSFAQLAANTHALLQQLQLGDVPVHLVGHSMGGMLAVRYALMFPQDLRSLSLVNPIGLEDWKALGVPWRSVDAWYAGEMNISYDSIRRYQLECTTTANGSRPTNRGRGCSRACTKARASRPLHGARRWPRTWCSTSRWSTN